MKINHINDIDQLKELFQEKFTNVGNALLDMNVKISSLIFCVEQLLSKEEMIKAHEKAEKHWNDVLDECRKEAQKHE